ATPTPPGQYPSTFHPQQQQQMQPAASRLQQVLPPSSSSPPSYTAMSDGGSPKKTPSPVPQPAPGVSSSHPSSLLSVAPPPAPSPGAHGRTARPAAPSGTPAPSHGCPPAHAAPSARRRRTPGGATGACSSPRDWRLRWPKPNYGKYSGDSNRSSGGSGGGGEGLMQEMNALLARRTTLAVVDALKKPWERSNSAERSSLVSRVRPVGSSSEADTEFDRMKQPLDKRSAESARPNVT
ncbi:hypothetical protein CRUP_033177, partial [Coryphaenoides rupestris]